MKKPQVRAEGIISNDDLTKFLVQCDSEESFYRFPGGGVEFGETAAEAIYREFIEEFDLRIKVGPLALINESIVEYDDVQRHDVNFLHWCKLGDSCNAFEYIWHREHDGIKLIWKNLKELELKPLYPEGIMDILRSRNVEKHHHNIIRRYY